MNESGRLARRLKVQGHRCPVPHPDPESDGREEHWVVIVGDGPVLDLTRRQFDPGADPVAVYADEDDLGRHWRRVICDDGRTVLRDLPPGEGSTDPHFVERRGWTRPLICVRSSQR